MKRLITAIIGTGLFLSCNSFAYSFTTDCGNCGYASGLCAPKFRGGFSIGVTGSYLQPTASGTALNDFVFGRANDDLFFNFSDLHRFDIDRDWGWGVNIAYDLPCTAYSLTVDYFHIDNEEHRHDNTASGFDSIASFWITNLAFPIGERFLDDPAVDIVVTDYNLRSHLEYKFDKVDLTFGRQYNDVCGFFSIKPAVGLRYAKIDHHYNSRFDGSLIDLLSDVEAADTIHTIFDIHNHSEFDGIGPVASLDTRLGFCNGFGVVGHFDAALIVGNVDSHLSNHAVISPLTAAGDVIFTEVDDSRWHTPSVDRVVTSLSGKVGLDYSFCLCNKSSLTFEVGYQASKYFDAIDLLRGTVDISDTLIGPIFNTSQQLVTNSDTNDFEFRGPYVNVTWHI